MSIKYSSFPIRGIDCSTFNGVIDWTDMPANFSGIRVGYGRSLDTRFNVNWTNCKINKFGYWYLDYYSNWYNSNSAAYGLSDTAWGKEQAENCYKFMGCNDVVFLDIESGNPSYSPSITSNSRAKTMARTFLERMDQLNKKQNGIYCSLGLLSWFDTWFRTRPLWVAWYPYRSVQGLDASDIIYMVEKQGWKVKPIIWQYASDGIVNDDGIKAGKTYFKTQLDEMDLNGWVGTNAQYEQMFSTNVVIPDPIETPDDEVIVQPNTRVIQVKYTQSKLNMRKQPKVAWNIIETLPLGKKLDCLETIVDGNNVWQRVGINQYVAEIYDGITYLK